MVDLTGFIVEVTPIEDKSIEYLYDGKKCILNHSQEFIGYFWQMTGPGPGNIWRFAHISKISQIDYHRKLYKYEKEAIFETDKVKITLKAKRGPVSNNRFLPEEYDKYETWDIV